METEEDQELNVVEYVFKSSVLFHRILHYLTDFICKNLGTTHSHLDPFYARWLCGLRLVNRSFNAKIGAFVFDAVRFEFIVKNGSTDPELSAMRGRHQDPVLCNKDSGSWLAKNVQRINRAFVCFRPDKFDYEHIDVMTNLRSLHLTYGETSVNVDLLPRSLEEIQFTYDPIFAPHYNESNQFISGTLWPPNLTSLSIFSYVNEFFAPKETIESIGSLNELHTLVLGTWGIADKPWFCLLAPDSLKRLHVHPNYIDKHCNVLIMNDRLEELTLDLRARGHSACKIIGLNRNLPPSLKCVSAAYPGKCTYVSMLMSIVVDRSEIERSTITYQDNVTFVDRSTLKSLWPPRLVHLIMDRHSTFDVDVLPILPDLCSIRMCNVRGLVTMTKFPKLKKYIDEDGDRTFDLREGLEVLQFLGYVFHKGLKSLPTTLTHLKCSTLSYKMMATMIPPTLKALELRISPEDVYLLNLDALPVGLVSFTLVPNDVMTQSLNGSLPPGLKFLCVKGKRFPIKGPLPASLEYLRMRFVDTEYEAKQLETLTSLKHLDAKVGRCVSGTLGIAYFSYFPLSHTGVTLSPSVETRHAKVAAYSEVHRWSDGTIYHMWNAYYVTLLKNYTCHTTTFGVREFADHAIKCIY